MDETVMVNGKTGHRVRPEFTPCQGVYNLPIYDKNDTFLGRAFLIQTPNTPPILVDIYIPDPLNRRKGIASELMQIMTAQFPAIVTRAITKAGRELCLKFGFQWKKALHKKGQDVLVYVRDEDPNNKVENIKQEKEDGDAV